MLADGRVSIVPRGSMARCAPQLNASFDLRLTTARALTAAEQQRVALAARKGWIAACHARRVEADARARARDWLSGAAPAARELRAAVLRAADGVVFTPVGGNGGGNARDEL